MKVCGDSQVCQLFRELIVVIFDGIRNDKVLSVRSEGTPLCQELFESRIAFCIVCSPGIHDSETESLDLLREKSHPVIFPGLILIALEKCGLCKRIDRIRYRAEKSLKVLLSRHLRVMADDLRVILKLVHADVLDAGADRRDSL